MLSLYYFKAWRTKKPSVTLAENGLDAEFLGSHSVSQFQVAVLALIRDCLNTEPMTELVNLRLC